MRSRIVDDAIQPTEFVNRLFDRVLELLVFGDVAHNEDRFARSLIGQLGGQGLPGLNTAREDGDQATLLTKDPRAALPDSLAAARHDHHAVLKSHQSVFP